MLLATQQGSQLVLWGTHFGASEPKSAVPPSSCCAPCIKVRTVLAPGAPPRSSEAPGVQNCRIRRSRAWGLFSGASLGSPGAQFWPSTLHPSTRVSLHLRMLARCSSLSLILAHVMSYRIVSYGFVCACWLRMIRQEGLCFPTVSLGPAWFRIVPSFRLV